MDAKAFGAFLAALRKEKQMTQKQLAEQLHVTDKAVSKWERGVGLPDLSNMETLAEVLGITLAELIQCKRQEAPMVGREELDQVASIAMELAEYQRRDSRRRLIWGLIFCGIGGVPGICGDPLSHVSDSDGDRRGRRAHLHLSCRKAVA